MFEHLPLPIVLTYCVYALFAAQQKFCLKDNRIKSEGYFVLLGYFTFVTMIFGIGFLIYYGVRTVWWCPFVLYASGIVTFFLAARLTIVREKLPTFYWGMASFIAVPVCAAILIHFTP